MARNGARELIARFGVIERLQWKIWFNKFLYCSAIFFKHANYREILTDYGEVFETQIDSLRQNDNFRAQTVLIKVTLIYYKIDFGLMNNFSEAYLF